MKNSTRDTRILIASFALLFIGLAVLSVLLLRGQSRNTRILLEYETDRTASELLDAFRATGDIRVTTLDTNILAFGMYAPSGEALALYGAAPFALVVTGTQSTFRYEPALGSLTLVRALGTRGPLMMGGGKGSPGMMRGGMRSSGPAGAGGGALFLRVKAGAWYGSQRLFNAGTILAPLIVGGIAAAFLLLLLSNLRYRRAAEERSRLMLLGESARTLAHEIRNPLGAIRIQTGLLRRTGAGGRELDIIDEEVERLNTLARRVGDFLKNPRGQPEPIDLAAFLADIVRRVPGPVRLDERIDAVIVDFDPALLRSVVENLLRNSQESAESEIVEIGLVRDGKRVAIFVWDRGPGIPPHLAEKVFDPFFTSKIRGSGLGLALSRRFVEASGGTLTLAPRAGGGTEARIDLPVREAP